MKFIWGGYELSFPYLARVCRYLISLNLLICREVDFLGLRKETGNHVNILSNDIQVYLISLNGPQNAQITEKDNRTPDGRKNLEM